MAKFSGLRDLKKEREEHPVETKDTTPAGQEATPFLTAEPPQRTAATRIGKRNNPEYVQRTAYIRKKTDQAVKMKLLQQGEGKEFSELVDELLSEWLRQP